MNKIIVCTHKPTYNSYNNYWSKTGLDFTYLSDNTSHPLDVGLTYTEQDIRDTFQFEGQVSKTHYWNSFGNRNIIWFYAHFRMMYYYLKHPSHSYYWFFDDDVSIDNWDIFFDAFKDNKSDFISYYCFKEATVQSQTNIPNIDNNTTSTNFWFQRFPGNGDILYDDTTEYFGSFFPIVRLSNMALARLVNSTSQGLHGYSEGFVPTILNYFGYSLDTIFNSDSQSKHFDKEQVNVKHKNGIIDWSWI